MKKRKYRYKLSKAERSKINRANSLMRSRGNGNGALGVGRTGSPRLRQKNKTEALLNLEQELVAVVNSKKEYKRAIQRLEHVHRLLRRRRVMLIADAKEARLVQGYMDKLSLRVIPPAVGQSVH